MSLVELINNDLKLAMKEQNKEKLNVLRMVKGAMQVTSSNPRQELSDDEVINVISKQIKMRKDSIVEFEKAQRNDLIQQYQQEIDVLVTYMPEQLSKEEVKAIIDEAFTNVKPTSPKQMGLIMKEVTPKVKGKFDMGEVSKMIKEKLSE